MILSVHERILRDALADRLDPRGLRVAIHANLWCDFHQLAPEYHFDSASSPRALCGLWQRGVGAWLTRAVALAAPRGSDARRLRNRHGALVAFGRATHALADFYAHTNWIELAVGRGELPTPAPLLEAHCEPAAFPHELQSGYFHLRHGLQGCPRTGPPHGYAFCHAQLNKDSPTRGHGAERIAPDGPTLHEIAVELSVDSTRAAWDSLHTRLTEAYGDTALSERVLMRLATG
jgi:hypothetical protein